ncbi:uncharacterized protein EURHEDRAFT_50359 [Aspergillus ruber CBS 135680]|uniref:Uncharacterized protein n=1 Tax=Aspergillus ruber (strain CBS 135680) TaxID=1388766 RepID=A0A017SG18_ASPRC|nr:uncharacterized protein EURHEDRAFT_50359 [Aspergillus ruber CBS 135680]EYE95696.1 hypothetical protein EURHEDRAFT_50359 [Aspergillus ruber CBS 135680]
MAGGGEILNNHAWSRQPKGFNSRKAQWPTQSIEGIIELPFKSFWCVLYYGGIRTISHITHGDSVRSSYLRTEEVFVAPCIPGFSNIIPNSYARAIPECFLCQSSLWTVNRRRGKGEGIKREQAFSSSIVGIWYDFLAVHFLLPTTVQQPRRLSRI